MAAYRMASGINAANMPKGTHAPQRAAVLASAYWGSKGVDLSVSFMEATPADLRDRIISHMNAWNTVAGANVQFRWTQSSGQVRISRGRGGYWSYLGVDVLAVPANEQTMNLEGFTMSTPESEYKRVVRHETGHTLGMPHEHLRADLVALLDPVKTEAYFMRTQGWSRSQVDQQVLTPVSESSLLGATPADVTSIMCYQIPGECTKSGKPILGGSDIDDFDKQCIAGLYPQLTAPPPPPITLSVVFPFHLSRVVRKGGSITNIPQQLLPGDYAVVRKGGG